MSRFSIGRCSACDTGETFHLLELRFDTLQTAFTISGSTSSCMLCLILGARSIILAFLAVKSAMAKRKYLQGKRWPRKCQKEQLLSEQSISIQGGRRAKITHHTHATVVRHELKCLQSRTRDQNNDLSMAKLEKSHYGKLKAQRKENKGAWSLGCDSN